MEDYILREINKIGIIIRALLQKARLLRQTHPQSVYNVSKTELLEKLDLDLDAVLEKENFIGIFTDKYGFTDEDLEKFAELLFDFAVAAPLRSDRMKFISRIQVIYRYLNENGAPYSFNRYYILKELEKYLS